MRVWARFAAAAAGRSDHHRPHFDRRNHGGPPPHEPLPLTGSSCTRQVPRCCTDRVQQRGTCPNAVADGPRLTQPGHFLGGHDGRRTRRADPGQFSCMVRGARRLQRTHRQGSVRDLVAPLARPCPHRKQTPPVIALRSSGCATTQQRVRSRPEGSGLCQRGLTSRTTGRTVKPVGSSRAWCSKRARSSSASGCFVRLRLSMGRSVGSTQ